MEWVTISNSATERTERAVTDDGEVLYRTVWMVPPLSPRTGQPMQMAFGFAVGCMPPIADAVAATVPVEPATEEAA